MDSFPNQTLLSFLNLAAMGQRHRTSGYKPEKNYYEFGK
jgi:hypothetical protein